MPSHQDRVRQNYCDHQFPNMDRMILSDFPELLDGRKCLKCGIDWDKLFNRFFSIPPIDVDWIKKRFVK